MLILPFNVMNNHTMIKPIGHKYLNMDVFDKDRIFCLNIIPTIKKGNAITVCPI